MRKGILVACVLVGAMAVMLFVSRPDLELRRLQQDRLATYLPPGAKQTYRHDAGKGLLPILGATPRATVTRRIGSCRRRCFESLINEAVRACWRFPSGVTQRVDSTTMYLLLDDRYLLLLVFEHDIADPQAVGVLLGDERLPLPEGWSEHRIRSSPESSYVCEKSYKGRHAEPASCPVRC